MGFWSQGIADLIAMGVPVSLEQMQALEEGGEILHVQGLLSPWQCYGDATGVLDQHRDQVYVPAMLHAYPPDARLPGFPGDQPVKDWLDDMHGSDWRVWPSYIGEDQDQSIGRQEVLEEIAYVRVWDGVPLRTAEERDVAEELFAAARNRINSSVYEEFYVLSEFELEWHCALEQLGDVLDGKVSTAQLAEQLYQDQDYIHMLATAYDTLLLGGFLTRSDNPDDWAKVKEMHFAPMEAYLPVSSQARRTWSRLINRRENALAIIGTGLPGYKAYQFDHAEREYL